MADDVAREKETIARFAMLRSFYLRALDRDTGDQFGIQFMMRNVLITTGVIPTEITYIISTLISQYFDSGTVFRSDDNIADILF